MRIISGLYGKRRFSIPHNFKARPTTDFAKENIFNVLENSVEWENADVLDLFAGTGSIGFEFLSRGCRSVIAVEKNAYHYSFIRDIAKKLDDARYRPLRGDVFTYLSKVTHCFDIIFADPPYDLPNLSDLPELIFSKELLKKNGIFILEHPKQYSFKDHMYFSQQRTYGSVNFSIFSFS